MSELWAVILAAGSGSRLQAASGGVRKQYLDLGGVPLFWRSGRTLSRVAAVSGLVFVFPPDDAQAMREIVQGLNQAAPLGLPWRIAEGGERRQDSVRLGLAALPASCGAVLVHDAARPFATARLAQSLADALAAGAMAVIPALPVTDTVKRVEGGRVLDTLDRSVLRAVQTPQAFRLDVLLKAHERAVRLGIEATDDASLVEPLCDVFLVQGEEGNVKITHPGDLGLLQPQNPGVPVTGFGYDVHRYGPGRPFVLGGIAVPGAPEVVAHSDGDVLLHALMDAILGCIGAGDIGGLFPDTDHRYAGIESSVLLAEVLARAAKAGLAISHADLTVIAQTPRIAPHRDRIAANVARLLELPRDCVNVKATTEEGLGFTGEKKGIKAVAVVTGTRRRDDEAAA